VPSCFCQIHARLATRPPLTAHGLQASQPGTSGQSCLRCRCGMPSWFRQRSTCSRFWLGGRSAGSCQDAEQLHYTTLSTHGHGSCTCGGCLGSRLGGSIAVGWLKEGSGNLLGKPKPYKPRLLHGNRRTGQRTLSSFNFTAGVPALFSDYAVNAANAASDEPQQQNPIGKGQQGPFPFFLWTGRYSGA
jgi:hypothetical protein